jgi:hypothetical protein
MKNDVLVFGRVVLLSLGMVLASAAADSPAPKPWLARGKVTDVNGKPVAGAEIIAHCGVGTLLPTGKAISGPDGTYELRFGPGVLFGKLMGKSGGVQAATISVRKPGFFETNLYRQGDLLAAYELPEGEIGWGKKRPEDIFLPDQPKTLNFVLAPAGSLKGQAVDQAGKPLVDKRIGLSGDKLPPSSSVLQEKKTDAEGKFDFSDVPTGYSFKLYVDDGRPNWREWPSTWIKLDEPVSRQVTVRVRDNRLETLDKN